MSRFGGFMSSVKFMAMSTLVVSSFLIAISDGQISWCTESSCPRNHVCCGNNGCIFGSNCVGLYCENDSKCSRNESCCSSECTNTTTCLGQHCGSDLDCSSGQSCCGSECRDSPDCVGYSCSSTSDCDKWEFCCEGTCSKADCFTPTIPVQYYEKTPFLVGTIVGAIVFGVVVSFFTHFVCRRQRSPRGRDISEQPILADPPQYEQQQTSTTKPPPYSPGTTIASEQPPPYTAEPQGRSGGVNTSLDAYGTFSNPPTLPV